MQRSNYRFTLDIRDSNGGCQLDMKRGDTHRSLHMVLIDGGCPYYITEDCFPVLMAKTEDGRLLYSHCTVEDGTVVCDLTSAYTATAGSVRCELRLYDAPFEGEESTEAQLLTSATFVIRVHPTVYTNGEEIKVADSVEATALTTLVTLAREAVVQANVVARELEIQRDTGEFDGMSIYHRWDGTKLSVTSRSGTSAVDLKGEKGDPGEPGPMGECKVDDSRAGADPWSGLHTVETLCPPFKETGSFITATPVKAAPVLVSADSDTTVTVCGKNLFDPATPLYDGYIHIPGGERITAQNYRCTDPIPAAHLAGKVLTLNKLPGGADPGMGFYAEDNAYLGGGKGTAITVPNGTAYLRFSLNKTDAEKGGIQLEIGSSATPYQPYQAENYAVTVGNPVQILAPGGQCHFFANGTPLTVSGYSDLVTELKLLKENLNHLKNQ